MYYRLFFLKLNKTRNILQQQCLLVVVVILAVLFSSCKTSTIKENAFRANVDKITFESNIVDSNHIDCTDIKYGFEGGDFKKVGDTFHLFVNEKYNDVATINNRFGHWISTDLNNWQRKSTVLQFNFDTLGNVPNACIYNPELEFSKKDNSWYLFYMQFKSEPSRKGGWYNRYDGRVMLSKSKTEGINGISGPYEKGNAVFQSNDTGSWEGLQGVTGFSPYPVGNKWYALYGSANTENIPCDHWRLGVATSNSLTGIWHPIENNIPIPLEFQAESPKVNKINNEYFAIVDEISGKENFSLLVSKNGIDWDFYTAIEFLPVEKWQWKEIRTPIGFFVESDTCFTFYTTYYKNDDFAPISKLKFHINHNN